MKPKVLRSWVNWAIVAAAAASVGTTVATRNTWSSAERMVRGNNLVVGFRNAEIRRVTLLSGGEKLVLARGDFDTAKAIDAQRAARVLGDDGPADVEADANPDRPRWQFVEPYQGEAEEAAVDSLLRAIEFAPFVRKVEEATLDRRAAGLDSPLQTIELDMGEVRTRVHVGANAPTPPKARYVEIGGEGTANKGVYVVSETTAKELLVRPDAFRVRQVVPYGATSLKTVTLKQGSREVVLQAGPRGDWRLARNGKQVRLDRDAVQRLFAALSRSRAEHFVADVAKADLAKAAAAEAGVVEATFVPQAKDKPTLAVRFGGPCPTEPSLELAVHEGTPSSVACTVPLHLDTFVAQLPALVDRHMFGQHLDMVEELQVVAQERSLELARRQDGWAMRSPRAGLVERDVGDAFVASLLDAQGELGDKPEVETTPVATVKVFEAHADDQVAQPDVVEVFAASPGGLDGAASFDAPGPRLFAHRTSDDAWLSLGAKHRGLFTPNVLLLEATQLLRLEADQVTAVRVQTPEWAQSFEYLAQPTGCRLLTPVGYQADSALCLDIIDELRVLRAKRWVAEADDGAFGLTTAPLRVVFTTRAQPNRQGAVERAAGAEATPHAGHNQDDHDHEEPAPDVATSGTPLQADAAQERTLSIGSRAPDGSYYAQLSPNPAVFTLRPSVIEALSTLVVDRAPFLVDAEAVQSLLVRTAGGEVRLNRLGDELVGAETADPVALVDALSMVRPEAAVALLKVGQVGAAPEVYGFGKPLLDVTVKRRVDDTVREFRWVVGRGDVYRDIGIYYAMPISAEPSAVFALPREVVQRILDAL